MKKLIYALSTIVLLGSTAGASGPNANSGFRLLSPPMHEGVAAGGKIEISVAAFGMVDVTKATVSLTGTSGWSVTNTATGLFTKDGASTTTDLVVTASPGVHGDALLGTFTLTAAGTPGANTKIEVGSISLFSGSSATPQDNFSSGAYPVGTIGLVTVVNPSVAYEVETTGKAAFPEEWVRITAHGPKEKGDLTAQIRRYDVLPSEAVTTVAQKTSVTLKEKTDDPGVYEGVLDATRSGQMLGWYYIDLESGGGLPQAVSGAGGFALAHTIVYVPDPLLVGPGQKQGVEVPLLAENNPNAAKPTPAGVMKLKAHVVEHGQWQVTGTPSLKVGPKTDTTVPANLGWKQLEITGSAADLTGPPTPVKVLGEIKLDLGVVNAPDPSLSHADGQLEFGVDVLFDGPNGLVRDDAVVGVWGSRLDPGWGDVSGDGRISAVDASLVLMHTVGKVNLSQGGTEYPADPDVTALVGTGAGGSAKLIPVRAAEEAEVTGNKVYTDPLAISPLDASFILRRAVQATFELPVEFGAFLLWQPSAGQAAEWDRPQWSSSLSKPVADAEGLYRTVSLGMVEEGDGSWVVPVAIDEIEGVLAGSFVLEFDGQQVEALGVEHGELTRDYLLADQVVGNTLRVSFAGLTWKDGSGDLARVQLRPREEGVSLSAHVRLVEVSLNEGLTPVRVEGVSPLPRSLALYPNFPNPFNPSTTLRFDLPAAGEVELSVYNVVGQQIRTLVKGAQEPGHYRLEWDGLDEAGRQVASGTYMARLESSEGVRVQKMLMVK